MKSSHHINPLLWLLVLVPTLLACELTFGSGGSVLNPSPIPLPTRVVLATNTPRLTSTPSATATHTPGLTTSSPTPTTARTTAAPTLPPPTSTPIPNSAFAEVHFTTGMTADGQAVNERSDFPQGITLVYGLFDYRDVNPEQIYRYELWRDGELTLTGKEGQWQGKSSGQWWVSVYNAEGTISGNWELAPGNWELRLFLDGQLQQTGEFRIVPRPSGQPGIGPITIAASKSNADEPVDPVKADAPVLPAGTKTIYAFFDGIEMERGTKYVTRWFLDGEPFTQPREWEWAGPPDGLAWVSTFLENGNPLRAGTYELRVTMGDRLVGAAVVVVEGTSATATPSRTPSRAPSRTPSPRPSVTRAATRAGEAFGPVTFAADQDLTYPTSSFPDGIRLFYAVFDYNGMQRGETWRYEWWRDGRIQSQLTREQEWNGNTSGSWWLSIYNEDGITAGEWEVRLYRGDQLKQTGRVTIEENPAGQPDFGPIRFASGEKDNQPVNPVQFDDPQLTAGAEKVYAFFDALDVPKGTKWKSEWYYDGKLAFTPTERDWSGAADEKNWWLSCTAACFDGSEGDPLAPGTYQLKLWIGERVVSLGIFIVL